MISRTSLGIPRKLTTWVGLTLLLTTRSKSFSAHKDDNRVPLFSESEALACDGERFDIQENANLGSSYLADILSNETPRLPVNPTGGAIAPVACPTVELVLQESDWDM